MKHTSSFIMACCLAAALSACGGGGSKSSSGQVQSSVTSSVASSHSSVVSSLQSMSSSSANSSAVGAKLSTLVSGSVYLKDSKNVDVDLDSADSVSVTLSLLDSAGNVISANSPKLIDSLSGTPHAGTPFTAELSGTDAKTIVVIVSKPGFSDYARRLEFSPEVNLTATLNQLQEITLDSTDVTSISGKVLSGYNVSVNNSNGSQEIVNGSASGIADLSVSIPQSVLPAGTSSVDVKMQAFNPNNPDEAQSFPGAYQDSTGNKLLSVAFNYTDIKTNTGVSLKKIAQKTRDSRLQAQKQSGTAITPMQFAKQKSQKAGAPLEPVIINRKIPLESCVSLSQIGDANTSQSGFQVPVYTYNPTNGLWDLLGYGTLFDEAGNLVPADQKTFDCSNHTYVLEIEATNEIFLSNWWNLDYPLVFKQPVKLCANIELQDEGSKPLIGSTLFIGDDDDLRSFSSEFFVTDGNGRVHIEVMSLDDGADLTATANVYNASLFSAYTPVPITLSTSCDVSAPPVVIPVAVPEMCKAQGHVVDAAGIPLSNRYVIAGDFSGVNPLMPAFAVTDANGSYDLSLQCKQNYQLIEWWSAIFSGSELPKDFVTNVNNAIGTSEVSDDGSKVILKDLVVSATKPFAYVSNVENSQTQINLVVMYGGTDFPLTYNFSLLDSKANVVGQYSGTLASTDFSNANVGGEFPFPYVQLTIDHKLPVTNDLVIYTVSGDMTDSKGNKSAILGGVYVGGTAQ